MTHPSTSSGQARLHRLEAAARRHLDTATGHRERALAALTLMTIQLRIKDLADTPGVASTTSDPVPCQPETIAGSANASTVSRRAGQRA